MTPFHCSNCDTTVYFENSHCGECNRLLGYVPAERSMAAFDVDGEGGGSAAAEPSEGWLRLGTGGRMRLRPCANRTRYEVCNWMLDAGDEGSLCLSCRLTEVIPSVDNNPTNLEYWAAIERAKRRLVYTLIDIGLTPVPKTGPDDKRGLAFHLLESLPGEPPVMTGHDDGLITLNIAEADDVFREQARVSMHEPVRTLLGHLRHEVSHYLQQRYISGTPTEERCREIFGDERADYSEALKKHYEEGAPADWSNNFVSAYASSHPWEDWAETCAHYLLVIDAVQTASSWGLRIDGHARMRPSETEAQEVPLPDLVLGHWLPVAQLLNAMNRSLGLPDAYPFLLPPKVLEKMTAVQELLAQSVEAEAGAAGGGQSVQPPDSSAASAAAAPPMAPAQVEDPAAAA